MKSEEEKLQSIKVQSTKEAERKEEERKLQPLNEEEQKDSSLDVQKDENNPGDNVSDKVKDSNEE